MRFRGSFTVIGDSEGELGEVTDVPLNTVERHNVVTDSEDLGVIKKLTEKIKDVTKGMISGDLMVIGN